MRDLNAPRLSRTFCRLLVPLIASGCGVVGSAGSLGDPQASPDGDGTSSGGSGGGCDGDHGGGAGPDGGGGVAAIAGPLHTEGGKIADQNGTPVRITGINWFGLETSNFAPHGLWQRSMDDMLDQVVGLGFNALRVPFSSQLFDAGSAPNGIDYSLNPDLMGKTGLEILDALVAKAGARGLKIILDRHRPDAGAQSALWYTSQYDEARWISDWVMLATRYKGNPTVIAADLHNEPHASATWGGAADTDWRAAATRAGNAILTANPDLLIVVEGIEAYDNNYYWWGGNLRGAGAAPVQLDVAGRVVYSPHDYPASIYAQAWFSDPSYPNNLPAVWDATWGYLAKGDVAPVMVGEFGTRYQTDSDKQWLAALASYMQDNGLSFTYWSLNPNSGDTGGILADDWVTVNEDKMSVLRPLLAPPLP